jgi:hypothetical protein
MTDTHTGSRDAEAMKRMKTRREKTTQREEVDTGEVKSATGP